MIHYIDIILKQRARFDCNGIPMMILIGFSIWTKLRK
jgi:hypothetical protein